MPRRSPVSLADVAAWDNLAAAAWRAARGKHHRPEVRTYFASLDQSLARLRRQILAAELPEGQMEVFEIHDPYLLESLRARAMVRYMDDCAFWADDRTTAREHVEAVGAFLHEHRGLAIKPTWHVGRSAHGLRLCGVRVLPHALRLSPRRRRRYRHARARWEALYQHGAIDAITLQRGYDGALAITAHTQALRFRLRELERRPAPEA